MLNEITNRMTQLEREIFMLECAQPHLKGCAASQNVARIRDRKEELETLEAYDRIAARFSDLDRCNRWADAESVELH